MSAYWALSVNTVASAERANRWFVSAATMVAVPTGALAISFRISSTFAGWQSDSFWWITPQRCLVRITWLSYYISDPLPKFWSGDAKHFKFRTVYADWRYCPMNDKLLQVQNGRVHCFQHCPNVFNTTPKVCMVKGFSLLQIVRYGYAFWTFWLFRPIHIWDLRSGFINLQRMNAL